MSAGMMGSFVKMKGSFVEMKGSFEEMKGSFVNQGKQHPIVPFACPQR